MATQILPKTSVRETSIKVILIGLAIIILLNLLARFGVLDWTTLQSNIVTLIGVFFLLSEVALMSGVGNLKKGSFSILDWIIIIVAIAALLGVIFSWVGITVEFLVTTQSIVEAGLMIFVLVEIFRKNR